MALLKVAESIKENTKKPTRYYSSKQESLVSKKLNGNKVKNSGATMFSKGDVKVKGLLTIECKTKTTSSSTITIHKDWLEKIEKESLFEGTPYSLLVFNFGPNEDNYYVLNEDLWLEFYEYLKQKHNIK